VLAALPGQTLLADGVPTLRFEGGRASGTDGCNRYSTTYTAKGSALEFGARGASTMMACPPPQMKQAEAFNGALARTRSHRVAGGRLELLSAEGTVVATFAAQSQSLAGTSWQVTGFNNGRQAVVSPLTGTELTMAFSADGKVAGSAGCNRYTSTWSSEGAKLALTPAAATRRMCPQPGIMEQEQQFLKALETVATARFEGDRLELRTADGALAATLKRATAN
jgi:heat shock protein HslJ